MQNQNEKQDLELLEKIYQEWIDGTSLDELAKKYECECSIIEDLARKLATNHEAEVCNMAGALLQERNELQQKAHANFYSILLVTKGMTEADRWNENHEESKKAIHAKAKRITGTPRFIYDDCGLLVDVAPLAKPETQPSA